MKDEEGGSAAQEALAGQIVCSDRQSLMVKTGEGLLSIQELQMEGKRRMDIEAFLRGCPVFQGGMLTRADQ